MKQECRHKWQKVWGKKTVVVLQDSIDPIVSEVEFREILIRLSNSTR